MKIQRIAVLAIVLAFTFLFADGCTKMQARCGHVIQTIILDGINFDFDKSLIKPSGKAILDRDTENLSKDMSLTVSIEGHCDIVGSDEYNQKLSERRAKAVYDYLASKGIDKKRMQTIGFGRTRPLVPNTTDEGRAKNRRVEINILQGQPNCRF